MTSPEERLRGARLRVTKPRLVVLDEIDRATVRAEHVAVSSLEERVRLRLPGTSVQAVYDGVDALRRTGLARRVEISGFPARYESRVGDNHHHLVCRVCGSTVDVDCAHGAAPCLQPSTDGDHDGFLVDEAEIVFWGLCPPCALDRDFRRLHHVEVTDRVTDASQASPTATVRT